MNYNLVFYVAMWVGMVCAILNLTDFFVFRKYLDRVYKARLRNGAVILLFFAFVSGLGYYYSMEYYEPLPKIDYLPDVYVDEGVEVSNVCRILSTVPEGFFSGLDSISYKNNAIFKINGDLGVIGYYVGGITDKIVISTTSPRVTTYHEIGHNLFNMLDREDKKRVKAIWDAKSAKKSIHKYKYLENEDYIDIGEEYFADSWGRYFINNYIEPEKKEFMDYLVDKYGN